MTASKTLTKPVKGAKVAKVAVVAPSQSMQSTQSIEPIGADEGAVVELPVDLIVAGDNDRTWFVKERIDELAESIRVNGLHTPIEVRPYRSQNGAQYQIIHGESRWRASKQAGCGTIRAIVVSRDDVDASIGMLIENVTRLDLNPMDEAKAYQKRIASGMFTLEGLAARIGKTPEYLAGMIKLTQLADDVQRLIYTRQMPLTYARLVVDLDTDRQRLAAQLLVRGSPTLAMFRQYVTKLTEDQANESNVGLFALDEFVSRAEEYKATARTAVDLITDTQLPAVLAKTDDRTAEIIYRYMLTLEGRGFHEGAAALGNVMTVLLKSNFVRKPDVAGLDNETVYPLTVRFPSE